MIFIARAVHGIEWVCAEEIARTLPAGDVRLARREVTFRLPSVDDRLHALRTVDDVFVRVGEVGDVGTTKDALPVLARRLAALDWSAAAPGAVPGRRFDVVASIEGRRTYNRYAVEAAAGAALAPVLGATFVARTDAGSAGESDLTVRLFLRGPVAVAALRLAARPLHRRAYKQDTGPGTLHPPLAAALARLTAPAGGERVLDPFSGDGTLAIEATLAYPDARVTGTDIDPARVANARANAQRAGVAVEFAVADAGEADAGRDARPDDVRAADVRAADVVLTNPPWNLAVDAAGTLAGSLDRFWRTVPGRLCAVTDADLAVPEALRRQGFTTALTTRVRLAGRVSDVVLAAPPGHPAPALPPGLATWREQAVRAGVVL
ncbi:MAG: methyltransferase domain-containing protein [Actinobacteria bacterium]|nr:MAG: methyltransferase domain-containing protein [Actinomycetota bacterium]